VPSLFGVAGVWGRDEGAVNEQATITRESISGVDKSMRPAANRSPRPNAFFAAFCRRRRRFKSQTSGDRIAGGRHVHILIRGQTWYDYRIGHHIGDRIVDRCYPRPGSDFTLYFYHLLVII